ncbi:hypothetical protein AB4305_17175 [Nocardia sp. 2YAB30]|uniref:hypothetical protein n=1 Tax=unclassified Nocardia TaxID=2637762 RepID=UPI003F96E355
MTITLADAEQWRHFHSKCWQDGFFRSFDHARFVLDIHSGHGPSCLQYLSASAYISHGIDHEVSG